jgi:hypothetical protein
MTGEGYPPRIEKARGTQAVEAFTEYYQSISEKPLTECSTEELMAIMVASEDDPASQDQAVVQVR